MARPQNSARGFFSKNKVSVNDVISVAASQGIVFDDYASGASDLLTASATGLKVAGGIALSGQTSYATQNSTGVKLPTGLALSAQTSYITQNSTGFAFPAKTGLPSARSAAKWAFLTNSTGTNAVMVNTTGTTWKYLNVTTVLPT